MTIEIDDLPPRIIGFMSRTNQIVLCESCNGLGFIERETEDYHTRTSTSYVSMCSRCQGDGRLIQTNEKMSFGRSLDEKIDKMPYVSFKDFINPNSVETRNFTYRLDKTDKALEKKYPKLAELNYENYDNLLKHYRVIELLTKEENPNG
jgi:hypothetical protein